MKAMVCSVFLMIALLTPTVFCQSVDYKLVVIQTFEKGYVEPTLKSLEGLNCGVYIVFPDFESQMDLPIHFTYKTMDFYIHKSEVLFFHDIPHNVIKIEKRKKRCIVFKITSCNSNTNMILFKKKRE